MKTGRYFLMFAAIVLLMLSSGCEPKIYYFSFEGEGDFTNDEGTWGMMNPGPYIFGSYGVVLNESLIYAPHRYSGDFTITCSFAVDLGSEETMLSFVLTPEPFMISSLPVDFVMITLPPISNDWTGFMAYESSGGEQNVFFNGAIQGLDTHGTNTIRIIKKGNTLSAELNSVSIFSRIMTKYKSRWSCISIYALTPDLSLWIRDFQVDYLGSRTSI